MSDRRAIERCLPGWKFRVVEKGKTSDDFDRFKTSDLETQPVIEFNTISPITGNNIVWFVYAQGEPLPSTNDMKMTRRLMARVIESLVIERWAEQHELEYSEIESHIREIGWRTVFGGFNCLELSFTSYQNTIAIAPGVVVGLYDRTVDVPSAIASYPNIAYVRHGVDMFNIFMITLQSVSLNTVCPDSKVFEEILEKHLKTFFGDDKFELFILNNP